jgi:hypothetical protein
MQHCSSPQEPFCVRNAVLLAFIPAYRGFPTALACCAATLLAAVRVLLQELAVLSRKAL